ETRYVWNKAGQIAEIHYRGEVTRYDYDSAGRLARKTLPGGSSQTYTLDAAGRLTRIEYHDRSGSLTDRLDLAHDAEGHI
ncbi:RHS repeat domain-containing protein, partial [Acinetobacter baumannii]